VGAINSSKPDWKAGFFNGCSINKRWGVHCNLRDRRVDGESHPLPPLLVDMLSPKIKQLNVPCLKDWGMNEANAIIYRPRDGHWLKHHCDDRFLSKEGICNLSLVGPCKMTYTRIKPSTTKGLATLTSNDIELVKVQLNPGTLQVLTGQARYDFTHGITKDDLQGEERISVTMRQSPLT
jgi:hypothetical protein